MAEKNRMQETSQDMSNTTPMITEHPPSIRHQSNPAATHATHATLRPLTIGNIAIGFPVVQAALSGYSDGPMRIIARRHGASYTLAEVMIDRFVLDLKERHRTRRHLQITDEEHPVGGQLMGSNPKDFGPAARKLVETGFDVIDINFGCPVKSTAGNCRGGYLLSQPDVALEIVSQTRDAVPAHIPVTLKMRRGLDDSSESRDAFFRILDGAFARGVAAITVHGRTVEQKYQGPSNWEFLREVKLYAGARTIIGSGDLFTPEACLDMLRSTGVDGVSVARGAIGNPWIFSQVRALAEGRPIEVPGLEEQRRVMELQFELCLAASNITQTLTTMRTFGVKFAKLHPSHSEVRNAFGSMNCQSDWERILNRWYPMTARDQA
jgi:tRNA-dihydrouridine synthase B